MPKTLFVVDDSATMRKVFELTFAGEDMTVVTHDGAEGVVARARELRPHAAIVDVALGGQQSGYDLVRGLREAGVSGVPIYLLYSDQSPLDEAAARGCGASGAMAKPFDSQAMIDRMRTALAGATATSQPAMPAVQAPAPMSPTPAVAAPVATSPAAAPLVSGNPTSAFGSPAGSATPPAARPPLGTPVAPAPATAPRPLAPPAAQARPLGAPVAPTTTTRPLTATPGTAPLAPSSTGSPGAAPLARSGSATMLITPAAPAPSVTPVRTPQPDAELSLGADLLDEPAPAKPAPAKPAAAPVALAAAPVAAPKPAPAVDAAVKAAAEKVETKVASLGLSPAQVEAVTALTREVVERVVWEVVPVLAETLIREEISRLTKE